MHRSVQREFVNVVLNLLLMHHDFSTLEIPLCICNFLSVSEVLGIVVFYFLFFLGKYHCILSDACLRRN